MLSRDFILGKNDGALEVERACKMRCEDDGKLGCETEPRQEVSNIMLGMRRGIRTVKHTVTLRTQRSYHSLRCKIWCSPLPRTRVLAPAPARMRLNIRMTINNISINPRPCLEAPNAGTSPVHHYHPHHRCPSQLYHYLYPFPSHTITSSTCMTSLRPHE